MPKSKKIPTYDEIMSDSYYGDLPLLNLMESPDVNFLGNILEIFEEFDIERSSAGELELSLMTLIGEAFRDPDERSDISTAAVARPKKVYATFLKRAEKISELAFDDPRFMTFMGLTKSDQENIHEKVKFLRAKVKELKGMSGGGRKMIKSHIPTVRYHLNTLGLGTNQQVEFLIEIFAKFKPIGLYRDRAAVSEIIYDWFGDTQSDYQNLLAQSPN